MFILNESGKVTWKLVPTSYKRKNNNKENQSGDEVKVIGGRSVKGTGRWGEGAQEFASMASLSNQSKIK